MHQTIEHRLCRLLLVAVLVIATNGCRSTKKRGRWFPPQPTDYKTLEWFGESNASGFAPYEHAYAMAREFEQKDRESCVDYYFQAATLAWPHVTTRLKRLEDCGKRATEIYDSSLAKFISTSQKYGRYHPVRGITIQTARGKRLLPVIYSGFPWQGNEFDCLLPVGTYESKDLNKQFQACGLGVATVGIVKSNQEPGYRQDRRLFSATVVLHPIVDAESTHALQIIDSLRVAEVDLGPQRVPLRRDLSAPFGFVLSEEGRNYLQAFIRPGSMSNNTGLFLLEPFQPGKIPVVFVHGLLSDPLTWVNLVNELRANPAIVNRYQFWGFEYSTGEPFLSSAATLREQLNEALQFFDPHRTDPALTQTVLIGHSMGGLVSKLQITQSGDLLWRSVSNCSFHNVRMTGGMQRKLADAFFFEPSMNIAKVVYIGTPHRGSPWAKRSVGSCASRLVEEPSSDRAEHEQLIGENPGVFSKEFSKRIPTSIDLLREDSPLLEAINQLPIAPHVQQHSIIGCYKKMIGKGESDGVVPISSAIHPNVESEIIVSAKHTKIHKTEAGVNELIRIMCAHGAVEFEAVPADLSNKSLPGPLAEPQNPTGSGSGYDF